MASLHHGGVSNAPPQYGVSFLRNWYVAPMFAEVEKSYFEGVATNPPTKE